MPRKTLPLQFFNLLFAFRDDFELSTVPERIQIVALLPSLHLDFAEAHHSRSNAVLRTWFTVRFRPSRMLCIVHSLSAYCNFPCKPGLCRGVVEASQYDEYTLCGTEPKGVSLLDSLSFALSEITGGKNHDYSCLSRRRRRQSSSSPLFWQTTGNKLRSETVSIKTYRFCRQKKPKSHSTSSTRASSKQT